jgi:hypothetical protein
MTLIAARFGVVTEDAFPLGKIPLIQCLHMQGPPALQGPVGLGDRRSSLHGYRQRPLPFQLRLLNLLAADQAKCPCQNYCDQII